MDLAAAFRACKPLYDEAATKLPGPRAMRVTAYAVTYRWMSDHLGHEPTIAEHAEAMDVSRAQYLRYRRDFREAFGVESPLDLPAKLVPSVPTLQAGIRLA
jgi:hypothetical protein